MLCALKHKTKRSTTWTCYFFHLTFKHQADQFGPTKTQRPIFSDTATKLRFRALPRSAVVQPDEMRIMAIKDLSNEGALSLLDIPKPYRAIAIWRSWWQKWCKLQQKPRQEPLPPTTSCWLTCTWLILLKNAMQHDWRCVNMPRLTMLALWGVPSNSSTLNWLMQKYFPNNSALRAASFPWANTSASVSVAVSVLGACMATNFCTPPYLRAACIQSAGNTVHSAPRATVRTQRKDWEIPLGLHRCTEGGSGPGPLG